MKVELDYCIDLGDLGERECLVKGEVREFRSFSTRPQYEVSITSVTVPWLDGMNVSGLLSEKATSIVIDELIGVYQECAAAMRPLREVA